MEEPEYLICIDCETPCYIFEFKGGEITSALCEACGADDPDGFATEEGFDAMTSAG